MGRGQLNSFLKGRISRVSAGIPIWQLARGSEIVQLPFHLQERLAMLDNFSRVTSRASGKDEDSILLLIRKLFDVSRRFPIKRDSLYIGLYF
jgi:hypothetical protein